MYLGLIRFRIPKNDGYRYPFYAVQCLNLTFFVLFIALFVFLSHTFMVQKEKQPGITMR